MTILKLTAIGNSKGVVFPEEMLERLSVNGADTLFAIETPSGYLLTAYDSDLEDELKLGRDFMKKYSDTFKALAK